jgi:hypothetical protein
VLSGDVDDQTHPDAIRAPVTSQIRHIADEVSLVNLRAAGLLKPSVVKPILSSFDVRLVRRKLGAPSASNLTQGNNLASTSSDRESLAWRLHKLC